MKKYILTSALFILIPLFILGQSGDPLLSKCGLNAGPNTTYLKDFRIQLGKGTVQPEFRQKQIFPLSKNMKYRFTLCNADNSTGQLVMKIKDSEGKVQVSSYDPKSGKVYPSVDFTCNKTGTYQILFDFRDFQQGLGVGIVSLVSEKK